MGPVIEHVAVAWTLMASGSGAEIWELQSSPSAGPISEITRVAGELLLTTLILASISNSDEYQIFPAHKC